MGCNCGKAKAALSYLYIAPDGTQTVTKSEVQAQVLKIKNGGGSVTVMSQ